MLRSRHDQLFICKHLACSSDGIVLNLTETDAGHRPYPSCSLLQLHELQEAIYSMPSRAGGTPRIFEDHADPAEAFSDDDDGCEILEDEPDEADPVNL